MLEQTCRICKVSKLVSYFTYRKDNAKYRTECDPCRYKSQRASRYNITVAEIEALIKETGNRCGICRVHAEDIKHSAFSYNPLVIDHNHNTGKVRGLLCPNCNVGLGHFKDSPEYLSLAINYLET